MIRSRKLLDAARDEACTLCGAQDGTVVAAHSNWLEDGRGASHKADDIYIAFLCHKCHYEIDYGNATKDEKYRDFTRAMKRTWKRLIEKGVIKI